MDKTNLHIKAENPSLIISIFLLLGIYLGAFTVISKKVLLCILIVDWISLLFIQHWTKLIFSKSIFAKLSLILWGYAIIQFQTNSNFSIISITEHYIQPIRLFILQKIDLFITNNADNHLSKALLIGEKVNINKEILEIYTSLGIVHIIAISGMHLELIAAYFIKIGSWIPNKKWLKLIVLLFLLSCIIIYTLIAHASPSIVRAAIFFSLFQIGSFFNLHKYLYNSIASGLLIILLFNHQSIYHIGWQLSYAAVIGIHIVHPRIQSAIILQNPIIQLVWNNFSITISTQLTTIPILVFYFNKISLGIVLSNMIMIPISTILLHGLILLIILPNFLNKFLNWGQAIEYYMQKMTQMVHYIFTISPQPVQITGLDIKYLLAYYIIFLYLCLWKKRFNQPLFRFSTKMV